MGLIGTRRFSPVCSSQGGSGLTGGHTWGTCPWRVKGQTRVFIFGISFGVGAVIGFVFGLATGQRFGDAISSALWGGAILTAALIAAMVISSLVGKSRDRARERDRDQQMREQRAVTEREALRQTRLSSARSAVEQAQAAVTAFERLPGWLAEIDRQIQHARRYRADSAFSPFWGAIEQAYAGVAGYRECLGLIELATRQHADAIRVLVGSGVDPTGIAAFPVQLSQDEAREAIDRRMQALDAIVYDAHRQADFANIYEHRRNTAAVINGFKSLDDAVSRMGSAVSGSISSLGQTMSASNASVSSSINALSGSLERVSAQQITQMAALNASAKKVHDEVFYVGHGRLPLT